MKNYSYIYGDCGALVTQTILPELEELEGVNITEEREPLLMLVLWTKFDQFFISAETQVYMLYSQTQASISYRSEITLWKMFYTVFSLADTQAYSYRGETVLM